MVSAGGDKPSVTCTCENFRRFGRCKDSELMAFICLGKDGVPSDSNAVDFNACKEGYDVVSGRLREKVLNLVDPGRVCVKAPQQDPSKVLQEPICVDERPQDPK